MLNIEKRLNRLIVLLDERVLSLLCSIPRDEVQFFS